MLILNRHKIAHYRLFEILKRTRGYPSIESPRKLELKFEFDSARQSSSKLGSALALRKHQTPKKKNCLIINYRMNSNSLYLGSGHRASSTISSSLSI